MEIPTMVGGAALAPLFQKLVDRLKSSKLLNFLTESGALKEVSKWKEIFKTIDTMVQGAEDQQISEDEAKKMLNHLRNVAFDLEDILDEFNTRASKRKFRAQSIASTSKAVIYSYGSSLKAVKFRIGIAIKLDEVSKRLRDMVAKREIMNLICQGSKNRANDDRTTSSVGELQVYGRKKDLGRILEEMKCERTDGKTPVIPIVGMGGVGKTTLAQQVYNAEASLQFKSKAWITVGERFDVQAITKSIVDQFGCGDGREDLSSLQIKLKERISGMKCLVILDDVWITDYHHWTLFYNPFVGVNPGSRIIVTTRNQSVSELTSMTSGYDLQGLSSDDCLSLLAYHALERQDFSQHLHLEELAKKIVHKCDGLPLAAKALGGILRGKQDASFWEELLKSKIWEEKEKSVLLALKLSYYHLPSHLKRCFGFTAIFPKDYEFDKTRIVLLWMAVEFVIDVKDGCTVFDDLVARSFFHKSSTDGSVFVMHDLINDLARSVSGNICFNLDEEAEKSYVEVRHSAFTCRRYEFASRFQRFHDMKLLRTFMALKDSKQLDWEHYTSTTVLDVILERLKYLRVLVLHYSITELPASIECLKHLRCLDVSYADIEMLPESLCKLFNLKVLILFKCKKLRELPKGFCNLINLECLDVREADKLKKMPLGIAEMKKLHILGEIVVGRSDGVRVVELLKIPNLQIRQHISALQNAANVEDVACWKMTKLEGIAELTLEWSNEFDDSRNEKNEEEVLSALKPQSNITELLIKQYGGRKLPSWIGETVFGKMKILKFYNCHNVESLPALGELPSLEELTLEGMNKIKEVGKSFYGEVPTSAFAFPSLKILIFENMEELYEWSKYSRGGHVFPKLKKLELKKCPKLEECSLSFPNLDELVVEGCREVVLRSSSNLASLTKLSIRDIRGLERLNGAFIEGLGSLQEMRVERCGELKHMWEDELNVERHLGCLKILSVKECEKLEKLPNELHTLTSLTDLEFVRCPKLETFPTRGLPYSVKKVRVVNCESLVRLADSIIVDDDTNIGSQIERLCIIRCKALNVASNLGFPTCLRDLWITDSPSIEAQLFRSLQLQNGFSLLTFLCIWNCKNLESFGDSIPIPTLLELWLAECKKLRWLPNHMNQFTSLQTLYLQSCPEIASFPEGGLPTNLKRLWIFNCEKLERKEMLEEKCLNSLTCLEELKILAGGGLNDVISFPHMLPTSLKLLDIGGFQNLKSITSAIQTLTSLQTLAIWGCPKLQSLPKLPSSLGRLKISECPLLEKHCQKGKGDLWPILASIPSFEFYHEMFL